MGRPILLPYMAGIVVNMMFLQERQKFRLEISPPMVFGLVTDVGNCCIPLGNSDRERSVSFLPFKLLVVADLVHPFRRRALDELNRPGDGQCGGQRKQ